MGIAKGSGGSVCARVQPLRRWAKVGRVVRTGGTHKDVRTGAQKLPGPNTPESFSHFHSHREPASFFMNIHCISILETQSPEKPRQVSLADVMQLDP